MHKEARDYCEKYQHTGVGYGLDIGGRDVNGEVRSLWPQLQWTVIDLLPQTHAIDSIYDLHVATYYQTDAATWEPDREYDLILCTEVFEHTEHWRAICAMAYEALALGANFIITCAGPGRVPHSGIDGGRLREGEWYDNLTATDLFTILDGVGFTVNVHSNYVDHDIYVHAVKF